MREASGSLYKELLALQSKYDEEQSSDDAADRTNNK